MNAALVGSFAGETAPCAYLIDGVDEPKLACLVPTDLGINVVAVPVDNWRDALTPWPAESLYRGGQAFGGLAESFLAELTTGLSRIEEALGINPSARGVAGYSLGGLFAAYALTKSDAFSCMASMSGSHWYPGWIDWIAESSQNLTGTQAFFSVGTKEKRASKPALKAIEERTQAVAHAFEAAGCVVQYETGPGGHMDNVDARIASGLRALERYLLTES